MALSVSGIFKGTMCVHLCWGRGGVALKTDEYVKIYEEKNPTIRPKGSISVLLVRAFAQKPEEEDE